MRELQALPDRAQQLLRLASEVSGRLDDHRPLPFTLAGDDIPAESLFRNIGDGAVDDLRVPAEERPVSVWHDGELDVVHGNIPWRWILVAVMHEHAVSRVAPAT